MKYAIGQPHTLYPTSAQSPELIPPCICWAHKEFLHRHCVSASPYQSVVSHACPMGNLNRLRVDWPSPGSNVNGCRCCLLEAHTVILYLYVKILSADVPTNFASFFASVPCLSCLYYSLYCIFFCSRLLHWGMRLIITLCVTWKLHGKFHKGKHVPGIFRWRHLGCSPTISREMRARGSKNESFICHESYKSTLHQLVCLFIGKLIL